MQIEKALEVVATWHSDPKKKEADASYLYEVHFWRHLSDGELVEKLKKWACVVDPPPKKDDTTAKEKSVWIAKAEPVCSKVTRDQIATIFNAQPKGEKITFLEKIIVFFENVIRPNSSPSADKLSYITAEDWKLLFKDGGAEPSCNIKEFAEILFAIASKATFSNQELFRWCTDSIKEAGEPEKKIFEKFKINTKNKQNETDEKLVEKLKTWACLQNITEYTVTSEPAWSNVVRNNIELCNLHGDGEVIEIDKLWDDLLNKASLNSIRDIEEFSQIVIAIASRKSDNFEKKLFWKWCNCVIAAAEAKIIDLFYDLRNDKIPPIDKCKPLDSERTKILIKIRNLFRIFEYYYYTPASKSENATKLCDWKVAFNLFKEQFNQLEEILISSKRSENEVKVSPTEIEQRKIVTAAFLNEQADAAVSSGLGLEIDKQKPDLTATIIYQESGEKSENLKRVSANVHNLYTRMEGPLPTEKSDVIRESENESKKNETGKILALPESPLGEWQIINDSESLPIFDLYGIDPSIISIKDTFLPDPLSRGYAELGGVTFELNEESYRTMNRVASDQDVRRVQVCSKCKDKQPIQADLPCIARAYLLAKITLCRIILSHQHTITLEKRNF